MRTLSYSLLLFVFWLILSGHFEPLLLGLGLASVALTVFLAGRMKVIDHESYPLHLTARLPVFLFRLLGEIIRANLDVSKRILSPKATAISPQWFELPLPQKTDLGRVLYANSITLTPGTVSVEITKDSVTVHALSREAAEDLSAGAMADMIPEQRQD
ncbi:MAG: Na+/H+ antiporter subunit E [Gammaproteobacteria bacterium]|nr:Na+/H+ antiporter subunit E [Gammaproteobacteria bacterium]